MLQPYITSLQSNVTAYILRPYPPRLHPLYYVSTIQCYRPYITLLQSNATALYYVLTTIITDYLQLTPTNDYCRPHGPTNNPISIMLSEYLQRSPNTNLVGLTALLSCPQEQFLLIPCTTANY